MLNRERAGTLNISSGRPVIGSLSIAFEGMRDIPSALFDADSLKRQQALESLRALDFTKRRPRVLFMSERDEDTLDIVVGWKKMRDASGYKLTLTDLNTSSSSSVDVGSAETEYPDSTTLSFYRRVLSPIIEPVIKERDVALYRFSSVSPDSVYSLSIIPYQRTSNTRNGLFRSTLNRLTLTDEQLDIIKNYIVQFGARNIDDITPFPFISKFLYGDERFGWMLSGLNLLSSFERGDQTTTVRSYSYIGAKYSDIRLRISAGQFYVPSDPDVLERSLQSSFSEYGLSNTLLEVLDKCGMLLFFDEREGFDVSAPSIGREAALRETSLVRVIIGAVDPESASVLPSDVYQAVQTRVIITAPAVPGTLALNVAQTPKLDKSDEIVDVLSFNGMSRLMNIIVDSSRRAN
jgi:hypothetical protein